MIKDLFFLVAFFEFYSCTDFWSGVCFWISQMSPLYQALVCKMKQCLRAWPGLLLDEIDWKMHDRNKTSTLQPAAGCSAPRTRCQLVQSRSLIKCEVNIGSSLLYSSAPVSFYYLRVKLDRLWVCCILLCLLTFWKLICPLMTFFSLFSSCAVQAIGHLQYSTIYQWLILSRIIVDFVCIFFVHDIKYVYH